ncbi:E3 ubiquitin-protein ligase TRIM35-like [Coregonus clupeaformis]|uniref:E3 ubiquitin-protein ligase TRIM35-like n=1 Tax=Coregonus clupeaformis TaxID=59861 RepID=UPI001BE05A43|nr:E3 ubiquitin-protein ligase TRIM35-like [Coregonus clupeaformis]
MNYSVMPDDDDDNTNCLQSQAQQTEKQIQEDFEKLHQFLRYEEAARIVVLREEEEETGRRMKKRIDDMNREMAAILDTMRAIKKDLVSDDISFLQSPVHKARSRACFRSADRCGKAPGQPAVQSFGEDAEVCSIHSCDSGP